MEIKSYLVEVHLIRIINSEPQFLLLKRAENESYPGIWQMVTGSIDENETAIQTALREINEETSLTPVKLWVVPNVNSFYSAEKDNICLVPVFVALINDDSKFQISNEHSNFKWVNNLEAKKLLAWSGQRKSVDIIYDFFCNKESTYKFIELNLEN